MKFSINFFSCREYNEQKHKKSKDYCKADLKQRILFFITIFRLAIPAFFRFTDVTEYNAYFKNSHAFQPEKFSLKKTDGAVGFIHFF